MAATDWSEQNDQVAQVSVGGFVSKRITWSKTDFRPTQYRVYPDQFLSESLTFTADTTGVVISGAAKTPWGYITATYQDLNGTNVTLDHPTNLLAAIPDPTKYRDLIEAIYDSTRSQDFYFTVEVDWEQLQPGTQTPKTPPVVGTESRQYYITFMNNWTGNVGNLRILRAEKEIIAAGDNLPTGEMFGEGPFGVGPFGVQ